jgi:hypothetical protein
MNPDQLATTNVWLGIIASVSVINLLIVLGAAFYALKMCKQATASIQAVEVKYIEPLAADVRRVLAHAEPLSADVRRVLAATEDVIERIQNAYDVVRGAIEKVDGVAHAAAGAVRHRVLPMWGLFRGVQAALSTFKRPARPALRAVTLRHNQRAL